MSYDKIIGIDLSLTSTGLCTYNKGVYNTYRIQTELKDHERLEYVTTSITHHVSEIEPEIVVLEGIPYKMSSGSRHWVDGLHVMVWHELYKRNIPYQTISPSVLKRFVTGNGSATKQMMILACNDTYKTNFIYKSKASKFNQDDECDAYCLVRCLQSI